MARLDLYQTPEHDCPYLSGQKATTQFIDPAKKPDIELYTYLSRLGFRRSGEHLYRPSCADCNACIPIRVLVKELQFSRNQKRCIKKAKELNFHHIGALDSDEHYLLYEKYINTRHTDGDMYPATRDLFQNFLLSDWANSQFMEMRHGTKLIGCSVYDRLIDGISAVYCYFDPDYERLSPGKLAILKQIQYAKYSGLEYLYLGYQIDECPKMNYKNKFKPVEQFIKMSWQRID